MAWDGTGVDPWLPERIAGEVDLQRAERRLYHEWLGAAAAWLTTVRRAVLAPFRRSPGRGRPDPAAVHAFGRDWTEAMNKVVDGPVKEIMETGYEQLLGDGYEWDTRPAATEHLAQVRNRMVRTPDEVFSMVAAEMARAANLGDTPTQMATRVEDVLTTTGTERWASRAATVARTEVGAALGSSRHDSFVAMAEELGGEWEHGWLATCCDGRTRPAHWEADGQRVPLGEPFVVGGEPLLYPGVPTGSAAAVINCRCGEVLLRPGEEWDLTGRQFRDESAVTAATGVFHLPGQHRQEDHAGDNVAKEILDAAEIERDYGPELDVVEFAEDLFAAAHPDVVTVQGRDEKDDDRFEILSWGDPAAAREWADLIDRIVEDAEVYDQDDPDAIEVSPNGLVDWLFDEERGFLVGYDRFGDVMVRFGDFATDRNVDNINDLDGFDLSGDEPVTFARALEDLADRAEEGEDEAAVTAAGVRRVRTPAGAEKYDQEIGTIIVADLPKLTVPQLRQVAKDRGVKLPTKADLGRAPRKDDIIAALTPSEVARPPGAPDLNALAVPGLRALAKERGIRLPTAKDLGRAPRRADIVAALSAELVESDEPDRETRTGIEAPGPSPLSTDPDVRAVQVENRVRAAYRDVAGDRGGFVTVAAVRDRLGDVPRAEVDAALRRMVRSSGPDAAHLAPQDYQYRLTAQDRNAAVMFGGRANHLIQVDDPSPRPLPTGPARSDRDVETDEPDLTLQAGLDAKARRAAARERHRVIARGEGTARLLAEVDELIGKKADDATIRARLDPALIEPEASFANADPAVLPALGRALATGDRAKLRAALTRQATKAGITPVGKAGQKVAFDPEQHKTFGDATIAPGDQVEVVRRGATLTLPDGEVVQLDRPRVVGVARPVTAKRPGRAREPTPEEQGRQRQQEIDRVTKVADAAASIDEVLDARDDEIGDPKVLRNRIETLTVPDDVRARMLAAVDSGDASGLLRVVEEYAASEDLVPIDRAGDVVTFDRQVHKTLGRVEDGSRVVVVRRGFRRGADGQMILNPTVEALEPGEVEAEVRRVAERDARRQAAAPIQPPPTPTPTPSAERLAGRAVYKAIPVRNTASLDQAITGEPGRFADIAGVPGNRIRDAIGDYESSGYQYVAAALRDAGGDLTRVSDEAPKVRGLIPSHYSRRRVLDQAEGIDAVMTVSRTTGPIEVHRGVDRGEDIFGSPLPTSLVGREWTEHSYVSTTISEKVARKAAGDGSGLRMRIHVPEGVGAIGVENSSPGLRTEREVLLDRNLTARVVADRVERGERVIDVEIVAGPAEPSRTPELPAEVAEPPAPVVPEVAVADYAARVAAVAQLAASRPSEERQLGGGAIADTTLRSYPDGRRTVGKVYGRRVAGTRAELKNQIDAETLIPLVLRTVGLRAPATHRVSDTEIVQEHIDGEVGAEFVPYGQPIPDEILTSDDGILLGLVDAMTMQTDRNPGNIIRTPAGRLVGIDNGEAALGPEAPVGSAFWQVVAKDFAAHFLNRDGSYRDNDLSPGDVATARSLLEAVGPQFVAAGRGVWHRRMLRRLDQVGKHAKGTRDRIAPPEAPTGPPPEPVGPEIRDRIPQPITVEAIGIPEPAVDPKVQQDIGRLTRRLTPFAAEAQPIVEHHARMLEIRNPTDKESDDDARGMRRLHQINETARPLTMDLLDALIARDGPPWGGDLGDTARWRPVSPSARSLGFRPPGKMSPTERNKISDRYRIADKNTIAQNASLRSGDPTPTAKTWARRMSQFIQEGQELIHDGTLHRGASLRPGQIMALRPGAVIHDLGFASTATDGDLAATYAEIRHDRQPGTVRTTFDIRVPQGTPVGSVGGGELVLDRGSRYRIVSSRIDDAGVVHVIMELMP